MSVELKIKAKSLAAESRMIRQEELKLKRQIRWKAERQQPTTELGRKRQSLYQHRTWDVRRESRATNLARAYIKGVPYRAVEPKTHRNDYETAYMTGRVEKLVKKYAPQDGGIEKTREGIQEWMST